MKTFFFVKKMSFLHPDAGGRVIFGFGNEFYAFRDFFVANFLWAQRIQQSNFPRDMVSLLRNK